MLLSLLPDLLSPALSAMPPDAAAPDSTQTKRLIDLPENDTLSAVLGNHLQLRLPMGTIEQQRGLIEPGAPLYDEGRTQMITTAGDERLLIRVFELFQCYQSDFELEGRQYLSEYKNELGDMLVERLNLPGTLDALAFQPENIVLNRDAIFLMGILVAHPDSSLQEIRFFSNRAAIAHSNDLVTVVRRIATSVRSGPSIIRHPAEVLTIEAANGLQLPLEQSLFVTRQAGKDFRVHRLALPAGLGSFEGKLGIYIGSQAAFQHEVADSVLAQRQVPGKVFNKPCVWHFWAQSDAESAQRSLFVESIVSHPTDSASFLHIFASAVDSETLEALRQQAERIRVQR